jgi:hypothetical protein
MIRPVPVTFAEANAYVASYHRHNGRLPSARLCVGIVDNDGLLRGVAIAGLPKARLLMSRDTLEVNRVCTDGVRNGCSMLYAAITRAAKALGYARLITYTLDEEDGASLKASGWKQTHLVPGGGWTRADPRRTSRDEHHDTGPKARWEIALREPVGAVTIPTPDLDDIPSLFDTEDGAA